jgi:hypothetical protein
MDAAGWPWQQCAMAEAKKGRGCFFYGCITLIVLVVLLIAGIYFGARAGIKYLRDNYTATKPVEVPPTTLSSTEGARVVQRVDDFKKALQAGTATAPLELSGDELDYVMRNSPGNEFKDHARLTITNNVVRAQLSMPLDMYGPTFFGRFFNGEADLDVAMKNGALAFQVKGATMNGKPIPSQALSKVNQDLQWRPEAGDTNAAVLANVERVEIKDNKIVFVPKGK